MRAAQVPVENVEPNSEDISTTLTRLEADTRLPEGPSRAAGSSNVPVLLTHGWFSIFPFSR